MVAFNFKARWASLVEDGIKRQTVRASLRASSGDALQLYYGQRTKACRKLRDAVCVHILRVRRDADAAGAAFMLFGTVSEYPARRFLVGNGFYDRHDEWVPTGDCAALRAKYMALLDGFGANVDALLAFFPTGFEGWLYRWDVPCRCFTDDMWFYVYPGLTPIYGGCFVAPSGRQYIAREMRLGENQGAIGLMQGIPADWEAV